MSNERRRTTPNASASLTASAPSSGTTQLPEECECDETLCRWLCYAEAPTRHGHVDVWTLFVPEGEITVVLCTLCGGRHEQLNCYLQETSHDASRTLASRVDRFRAQHTNCATQPHALRLNESVRNSVGHLVHMMVSLLGTADSFDARAFVLTESCILTGPFPAFAECRMPLARAQFATRETLREAEEPLWAVVVLNTECYRTTSEDPSHAARGVLPTDDVELLRVRVLTRTAGWQASAPIVRIAGTVGRGPARIGALRWSRLTHASPYTDGLSASLPPGADVALEIDRGQK